MVHLALDEKFTIINFGRGNILEKLIAKYLPRIKFVSFIYKTLPVGFNKRHSYRVKIIIWIKILKGIL